MSPQQRQISLTADKLSTLPFNRAISLNEFDNGFTYATTQALAQHVAYLLSDKIFTYSPESFDLDVAVKLWNEEKRCNSFNFVPGVEAMQTRVGAGSIALGYVFSSDFDLTKRHIPQSIIASSGSLIPLRECLNQLSLLHELANPFVAHIAAVDYNGAKGLVSDYVTPLELADDLGFGLVASSSAQDAHHMALFATALAKILPTFHVYDGVASRDTALVQKCLAQGEVKRAYDHILKSLSGTGAKHSDSEGKALRAMNALNATLKTKYRPFEYRGHSKPENVFVVFGSVESTLSSYFVEILAKSGVKIGVINVRLYRPFIEEEFIRTLPKTTRTISVLGQVEDELHVADTNVHSRLYQDVFAALTLSAFNNSQVSISDLKYPKQQVWSHAQLLEVLEQVLGSEVPTEKLLTPDERLTQVSVWSLDESVIGKSNPTLARIVADFPNARVQIRNTQDNFVQGGIARYDITVSSSNADELTAPFSANVAYVGSEKILSEFEVIQTIRTGGTLIVSLPGVKDEDLEKKIPEQVRNAIKAKSIRLLALDSSASPSVSSDATLEPILAQLSILQALEDSKFGTISKRRLALHVGNEDAVAKLQEELPEALRSIEIPESWEIVSEDAKKLSLRKEVASTSFAPFDQVEEESTSLLDDWIIAAKGAVFKEVYGTKTSLRPDAGVKTCVVYVKEHRRLTPLSYDRNVFHIEFDLADSGLTYAIGEALGIHAENDTQEVQDFIKWYGLNPDEVVQVPSRDDNAILENRTIYQALKQNVDIFGRPPKRFYEALAEFATDENDKKNLLTLSLPVGATEFKRRAEVDTVTFGDILNEFPSARPSFSDLIRIVSPLKRREYSIASAQHVTPTSVALLIVTVGWVDPAGRDRFGLATRYLNSLKVGTPVTVSVKPSVMKLPPKSTAPIIMAGLGTGLAPFRAFVQERAYQKQVLNQPIGSVLLYLGSRHQREEYLYGEEWEAYQAAGIVTLIGKAFSRDQPQKIYIQDRMRQTMDDIRQAYIRDEGSFYLCGPTWPVPDVTEVLQEVVEVEAKAKGAKRVDARREIETLKEAGRFVLEVY